MPSSSYEALVDKAYGQDVEGADQDSSETSVSDSENVVRKNISFLKNARDGFIVSQKTALQVSCWVTIWAAVSVYVRRSWLSSIGFSASSILCNVLFIVGADMGSTTESIYSGVIGSFWAWLVYWIFIGFFPEAYDGTNPGVWWMAMTLIFAYTFFFIFAKMNETVRFWALLSFTGGFAMNLVNPKMEDAHSSGGFKFDYRGTAENGLILYIVAGILAIIIFAIPPIFSLDRGQHRVVSVMHELKENIKKLTRYYSRDTATLQIISIKEDFNSLRKKLSEAEAYGKASWYESLGTSPRRLLTLKLTSLIRDLMETAGPLFQTVSDEDFGASHHSMMKHISDPLEKVVESTMQMVELLMTACQDGSVSREEKAQLQEQMNRMPGLVEHLQRQVKVATGEFGSKKIQQEVLGEHYVVLTICYLAQLVIDQSKFFIEYEGGGTLLEECRNSVSSFFTYDKGDVRWAFRSSCCLLVNFLIGWKGWCDWSAIQEFKANPLEYGEEPACFINEYTTGLANINVVLMSRYSGGTLKAALERVAAVVFASVVGQVGYVALGWCNDTSRILTVVTVFVVCWGFLYFTYDGSADTKGIAQRLAAITVSSLMADCSDKSGTAGTYSSSYHSLSEIILGVLVMTFFDTIFGDKPSATQAQEIIEDALIEFRKVYKGYFNGEIIYTELGAKVGKVESLLAEADAFAKAAVMEPRFWRSSFNTTLYESIIFSYNTFCGELIKNAMFLSLDDTTKLAVATVMKDEDDLSGLVERQTPTDPGVIEMLVADMNRQVQEPKTQDAEGEMPVSPDSRRCAVATMIQSLMKGMQELQTNCVKCKIAF